MKKYLMKIMKSMCTNKTNIIFSQCQVSYIY